MLALAAVLFVLAASPALAATQTVNCGAGADLQAAINAASAGDTLRVRGTCTGNFTIGKLLTLTGVEGSHPTLNGGGTGRTLTILVGATVVVERLTITAGSAVNGGGILNSGTLTLEKSAVSGNTAGFGGGIFNNPGIDITLTLEKSAVSGNSPNNCSGLVC